MSTPRISPALACFTVLITNLASAQNLRPAGPPAADDPRLVAPVPMARLFVEPKVWGGPGTRITDSGGIDLFRVPDVQKELDLTAEQMKKIRAAFANQEKQRAERVAARAAGRTLRGLTMLEPQTKAEIEAALSPAQRARFEQLRLQAGGIFELRRPEIAEKLKLGPAQIDAIEAARDVFSEENSPDLKANQKAVDAAREASKAKLPPDGDFGGAAFIDPAVTATEEVYLRNLRARKEKAKQSVLAKMTAGQRKAYAEMLGTPLDFDHLSRVDHVYTPKDAGPPDGGKITPLAGKPTK